MDAVTQKIFSNLSNDKPVIFYPDSEIGGIITVLTAMGIVTSEPSETVEGMRVASYPIGATVKGGARNDSADYAKLLAAMGCTDFDDAIDQIDIYKDCERWCDIYR